MIDSQGIYWQYSHGICEASDLGIPPGQFPDRIHVACPVDGELTYHREEIKRDSSGAIESVLYKHNGDLYKTITVLND